MKNIIKTCLCFAMLTYCTKSTAQVDTSTTQKLLQYIMQPLDKNQISTGFLEEYGCPMLPAATFNGTLTDSNRIDMNLWRTLYLQLQTGWTRTTTNPLPAITSVNATIKQNISSTLPIPIPLLIGQYNTVKSNAFTSNLLAYNNSTKQVNDVVGRTQNPYDLKTLFAACPNKNITTTGSESFIIQSNIVWNNTGKTISQIQIDFINGQGFQTVTVGTPISISYTDTGFKKWTIKITLNDNSILQCYNEYNVLSTPSTASRFQAPQSIIPTWGFINAVNGVRTGATVRVNYSVNNPTGTLRKPLIVVEGYDVSNIAPSLQPNYNVGDFIRAINEPQGYDFNNQLDNIAGYDLVFIDFNDGAADIVLNAGAVQEVINRVNANKVLDNRFGNIRQQNVVMGLSMGGLCARYALANMTKNFAATPTETRLLITHDSPHKGANVPLGLQYMIRMLGGVQLFGYNVFDIYPDYNDAIGLLDAPATQQLLLYRATTANAYANNTFLDATYRPMITFGTTGPQPTYRFIATALGNECASPLFAPGKTFINLGAGVTAGIYARFLFFKVPILSYKLAAAVEAYALPPAGSTNKIARVYTENSLKLFGFINIFRQLYNNTAYAPGTHLAIDGVPGSNYPLLDVDALNQLTTLPIFKVNLYVSFPLGPFLGGYFGVYAYNAGVSYNFTFVSVGSALDVAPYNTQTFSQKYVNGTNQNYPSTSETFIAQETVQNNPSVSNNVHIRFTARNSSWLFNEMENLPNLGNCSSECSNPFYITGPTSVCASGIFTIPGLQRGVSVTWSASPSGQATLTPLGSNQVTVTRINNSNATITLTATLGSGCSGVTPVFSKQVAIGKGTNNIIFNQCIINCDAGPYLYANIVPVLGGTACNWYYKDMSVASNPFVFLEEAQWGTDWPLRRGNRNYTIRAEVITPCGNLIGDRVVFAPSCTGLRVAASPNPTTGSINLVFTDASDTTSTQKIGGQILTPVRSLNSTGKTIISLFEFNTSSLTKQWIRNEIDSKTYNFNLAGLRKGLYILQADRDNQTTTTKIIIE
jgi:Secretion system C-terminal sorting domain